MNLHKIFYTLLQSVSFAILYTLAIYRSYCLNIRFAMGETIALTFFPIVALGIYQLIYRHAKSSIPLLSIGLSLVFYSHLLSAAIWVCFIIIIFGITIFKQHKQKLTMLYQLIFSGFLTLLMTSPLIINIIILSTNNQIKTPANYNLLLGADSGLPGLGDTIVQSLNNNLAASEGLFFIVILVGFIFYYKKAPNIFKISYWLMIITVILPTSLIPWYLLENTPLALIQFPWRILGIGTIFMAFAGSYLIEQILTIPSLNLHSKLSFLVVMFTLLFISISGISHFAYQANTTFPILNSHDKTRYNLLSTSPFNPRNNINQ